MTKKLSALIVVHNEGKQLNECLKTINFADEIGHQLELRGDYKDNSLLLNMSIGMKHSGIRNQNDFSFDDEGNLTYDTYKSVSFKDIISDMNFLNEDLRAHKPFRDIYLKYPSLFSSFLNILL